MYTAEYVTFQDYGVSLLAYENNSAWNLNRASTGSEITIESGTKIPWVYLVLELHVRVQ
jgi:hypothetical protein